MRMQRLIGSGLVLVLLMASRGTASISAPPEETAPVAAEVAASAGSVVYADSCSQGDVQDAIDAADDGDTVVVPADTCTWTTPASQTPAVRIYEKAITLRGAGIDQTIIVDGTDTGWYNESLIRVDGVQGKPFRITGFTFSEINRPAPVLIYGDCKRFRIDHCKFDNTTEETSTGISTSGDTYGVIDHCTFVESRVLVSGGGDAAWQQPLSLGTENAVYIEDCHFDRTHGNAIDANNGGRYVFRANAMQNTYVEAHSNCPSGLRATFSYEVYSNTLLASIPTYRPFLMRGGTGVIFGNTITGSYTSPHIHVDNQRSCMGEGGLTCLPPWDRCDGDSIYDGNQPGGQGYPCRDQIGRSTDSGRTTPQVLEPLYEWDNAVNGVADAADVILNPVMCDLTAVHIQEGRDFYNDTERPGYSPYAYPHPLTEELVLTGTPGDGTIYLDWSVEALLPVTATWHVDYYTQTASVYTATEPLSTIRSTVLTQNVHNYRWYTVTLHAMTGSTAWLSDTVRVMPTDLLVYLPLVREN
jgi:hypothetical protein